MSQDEWLIARLLTRLAFPAVLCLVFALLWVGTGAVTRRRWLRLIVGLTGTLLVALVLFLIAWEQASGS